MAVSGFFSPARFDTSSLRYDSALSSILVQMMPSMGARLAVSFSGAHARVRISDHIKPLTDSN